MLTNEHQINSGEGLNRIHPNFFVAHSTTYDKTFRKIDVFIILKKWQKYFLLCLVMGVKWIILTSHGLIMLSNGGFCEHNQK
jgi:hypothetical protein